ncbi:L-rhamnose mutarotase [Sphingobacterium sp. lm-10]|uniref:L-rhamnose mutarotase n=1 Tax=Sphingobacterium sp. lm-10 TaxID=2944904 RepID=UPI0020204B35|nr:L-rhamnose mutarotase [Sphingobacterium sp. lm-10]MCL7987650.1 L-rhamnose mutarotase [Sphingobacterium sp. lm-10]
MKRYVLALDLVDQPDLIEEYEAYHRSVWPEIQDSIVNAGIHHMAIYRYGHRLMMLMDVSDDFSFEQKAKADGNNERVQEWEQLMWKYQVALPGAKPGEKWVLMDKIFELGG